ncbi:unnamed protein product [Spirodela intermedia]|uniref:Uncharacterized protein n=2 Tax=Spirodela intermedia TaxID=51605 RepID=A0A7I8KKD0_SPIIN|nr:unnamed protein product [Spirodela intermedia]CAA6661075.1 unnamed protein product [Spirodela intermedia]CAA7397435.1 unnamed protein product [Spirodela intermedia]
MKHEYVTTSTISHVIWIQWVCQLYGI